MNNKNQIKINLLPGTIAWLKDQLNNQNKAMSGTSNISSISGLIQIALIEYRHKHRYNCGHDSKNNQKCYNYNRCINAGNLDKCGQGCGLFVPVCID